MPYHHYWKKDKYLDKAISYFVQQCFSGALLPYSPIFFSLLPLQNEKSQPLTTERLAL
jgi:hypothetical protein